MHATVSSLNHCGLQDHNLEVKGLKDRVKTLTDVQRLRLRKGFTSFRSKQ